MTMLQEKSQQRQQLILDKALKLFTQRGYFNTSVHDIQRETQVSIGSIYHHFGNKEAIAKALLDSIEEQMLAAITEIMAEFQSARERCKAIISYLFEISESDPDAMHYMLYAKHREFLPGEKPVCSSRPFTLMKEIVSTGMEAGEIRQMDVNVAAASIYGGPIRLIFLRLDEVLEHELTHYLEDCWECSWRAVTTQTNFPR